MQQSPLLFNPIALRGLELRNRVVISPMCTYSSPDGSATDWHLVHLGQFALGGAGLIFTEATAVQEHGRITHGDLGLWCDEQIAPLARIVEFLQGHGARAAVQLAHAGRKASMQRPWYGNGPLDAADLARGDDAWGVVAPSALPLGEGWLMPHELTVEDIESLKADFRAAARRALAAGFDVVEVHGAHGYLLHEFLSPLSNHRTDGYGGSLEGRLRLALEVAAAVRDVWPQERPLFFRISATDGLDGGWSVEESVILAGRLAQVGVDVLDVSSGGLAGSATAARIKRGPGFQVPFAERIRQEARVTTMAVGLILEATQAEEILRRGQADLIAVGREALYDPHWALHAQRVLGVDNNFGDWPMQYGWWLDKRAQSLMPATPSPQAA